MLYLAFATICCVPELYVDAVFANLEPNPDSWAYEVCDVCYSEEETAALLPFLLSELVAFEWLFCCDFLLAIAASVDEGAGWVSLPDYACADGECALLLVLDDDLLFAIPWLAPLLDGVLCYCCDGWVPASIAFDRGALSCDCFLACWLFTSFWFVNIGMAEDLFSSAASEVTEAADAFNCLDVSLPAVAWAEEPTPVYFLFVFSDCEAEFIYSVIPLWLELFVAFVAAVLALSISLLFELADAWRAAFALAAAMAASRFFYLSMSGSSRKWKSLW